MRWILKTAAQKAISALPNPEVVNYFFQSKVTNKLPASKESFLGRVAHGIEHFNAIRKHCTESDLGTLRGYEFGAGWDMIIPLAYYALGINDQTIVDIRSNFRAELVNDTILRLTRYRPEIEQAQALRGAAFAQNSQRASLPTSANLASSTGLRVTPRPRTCPLRTMISSPALTPWSTFRVRQLSPSCGSVIAS